ncbi:MAG: TIGR00730 family Rossman fold protein, partial [Bacteroidales bacterium]|nr:TIGR00730 family Rossman fold protein [Bacteroidales bacterium]
DAAEKLGEILAERDCRLIYGGGHRGLMGKIADTVLEHGGKVTGIIPGFMCEVEWNHKGLTELILVETMHERKEKLADLADAAVALPGGCGTMEELLEVITWKRLGIFTKPIIICNVDGYFDPLIEMLNRSVDENFMGEEHRTMWTVVSSPEKVMEAIENSVQWDENARKFAAL